MNSRERANAILNHQEADRVLLDLGGHGQSGMQVSTVYALRQALKLDSPGTPVKIIEPFQMLGEIAPDLQDALGVDFVSLGGTINFFGFKNENWKEWRTFEGTPVLVPELFNTTLTADGELYQYPQGDQSYSPCAKMPKDGYYFDALTRTDLADEDHLNPLDNCEEFSFVSSDELTHLKNEAQRLTTQTDRAICIVLGGMGLGDVALVPGVTLKEPKGVRQMEQWLMLSVTNPEFTKAVFARQTEIAIENMKQIYASVGDKPQVAWISGTDFGTQQNCFVSPRAFRNIFKPYYTQINQWIHENTNWKTLAHTCGSIMPLIPDLIASGFDCLNPVQISAANMDPQDLKNRFGEQVVFWGGGIDSQKTLPFGTVDEVRTQTRRNLEIFKKGGGYVFCSIHNVQSKVPIENLLAMYETFKKYANF